ncbi:MAG: hypothetical protein GAK35_03540 [Herbaspirillum frisingense]|uniref:Phage tail protein n=1 Tax=Herbaspirillum frisingense TaxID=92645 RepID=A0A7V8JT41_9BURK|nr:MAG: hypothetical protein GAK35_03540 [Herbaspirillum frisingense]
MNLLAGTSSVSVDGVTYQLEGSLKYSPSTVKRETLIGQDGVHGYKETPVPGWISFSLRDAGNLSVADINRWRDVLVVGQLANGKTVIGNNMWTTDAQEVDTTDAKFDVRCEGPSVTEQTSR